MFAVFSQAALLQERASGVCLLIVRVLNAAIVTSAMARISAFVSFLISPRPIMLCIPILIGQRLMCDGRSSSLEGRILLRPSP